MGWGLREPDKGCIEYNMGLVQLVMVVVSAITIFLSRWHPADMSGLQLISRWGGAQLTLVELVGGGGGGGGGAMQKKRPR